jgi:hypothetical protein
MEGNEADALVVRSDALSARQFDGVFRQNSLEGTVTRSTRKFNWLTGTTVFPLRSFTIGSGRLGRLVHT